MCPTRAIDLDNRGHVTVEASYCIGCGACVRACASRALTMEPVDPKALVSAVKYARSKGTKVLSVYAQAPSAVCSLRRWRPARPRDRSSPW